MEAMNVLIKIIDILVYPTLIIFVLLLFRVQINNLLSGKLSAKYKDLEISLENAVEKTNELKAKQDVSVEYLEREIQAIPENASSKSTDTIKIMVDFLKNDVTSWEVKVFRQLLREDSPVTEQYLEEIISTQVGNEIEVENNMMLVGEAIESLLKKNLISKSNSGIYVSKTA